MQWCHARLAHGRPWAPSPRRRLGITSGGPRHFGCQGASALKTNPAIAQLAEHLTVDSAVIKWSLVRFRVAGLLAAAASTTLAYAAAALAAWVLAVGGKVGHTGD